MLKSVAQQKAISPPRKELVAVCSRNTKEIPHKGCLCGIHAYSFTPESIRHGLTQILRSTPTARTAEYFLIAEIAMRGRIQVASLGYRAARAIPTKIIAWLQPTPMASPFLLQPSTWRQQLQVPKENPNHWKVARPYRLETDDDLTLQFLEMEEEIQNGHRY